MKDNMNRLTLWASRLEDTRRSYPPGTRVRLASMADESHPVEPGTCGTVQAVDDAGQLLMQWDNGQSLSLLPGVDSFEVLERPRQHDAPVHSNCNKGEAR